MNPIFLIGLLALVGVGGTYFSRRGLRLVFWALSVPPFCIGVFAWSQGGIAEPFSSGQMWVFRAVTFWPAAGCLLGEVVVFRRAKAIRRRINRPPTETAEAV